MLNKAAYYVLLLILLKTGTCQTTHIVSPGQSIGDWRVKFGHCGPTLINAANQWEKAPQRPGWPEEIDQRWGGMQ